MPFKMRPMHLFIGLSSRLSWPKLLQNMPYSPPPDRHQSGRVGGVAPRVICQTLSIDLFRHTTHEKLCQNTKDISVIHLWQKNTLKNLILFFYSFDSYTTKGMWLPLLHYYNSSHNSAGKCCICQCIFICIRYTHYKFIMMQQQRQAEYSQGHESALPRPWIQRNVQFNDTWKQRKQCSIIIIVVIIIQGLFNVSFYQSQF